MRNEDKVRILHMIESAEKAQEFLAGKTYNDLQKNEQLSFAVVRALEIIGEAAGQTTQEFRDAYPDIQWRNIISMRNKLVHAYFDINYKIVWSAVKGDISQLLQQLKDIKDEK
jgi:uncharacterized protein with HEPN domain